MAMRCPNFVFLVAGCNRLVFLHRWLLLDCPVQQPPRRAPGCPAPHWVVGAMGSPWVFWACLRRHCVCGSPCAHNIRRCLQWRLLFRVRPALSSSSLILDALQEVYLFPHLVCAAVLTVFGISRFLFASRRCSTTRWMTSWI